MFPYLTRLRPLDDLYNNLPPFSLPPACELALDDFSLDSCGAELAIPGKEGQEGCIAQKPKPELVEEGKDEPRSSSRASGAAFGSKLAPSSSTSKKFSIRNHLKNSRLSNVY